MGSKRLPRLRYAWAGGRRPFGTRSRRRSSSSASTSFAYEAWERGKNGKRLSNRSRASRYAFSSCPAASASSALTEDRRSQSGPIIPRSAHGFAPSIASVAPEAMSTRSSSSMSLTPRSSSRLCSPAGAESCPQRSVRTRLSSTTAKGCRMESSGSRQSEQRKRRRSSCSASRRDTDNFSPSRRHRLAIPAR